MSIRPSRSGPGEELTTVESSTGTYSGDDVDWTTSPIGSNPSANDQWKQPVRVASTATLTVSTGLNAGDTVDGVTLVAGDRVLLKDQSTASQNGIYVAGVTPERAADMDDDGEVMGALVYVIAGTANGGKAYKNTNTSLPTVGSTSLTFTEFGASGSSFATPAIVLGSSAAAGAASTVIRSDATIAAFDATSPTTQAFGDAAVVGVAAFAARRDHKHAMPTAAVTTSGLTQATAKMLGRSTASTGAIEEITVGTGLTLAAGTLSASGGGGGPTDYVSGASGSGHIVNPGLAGSPDNVPASPSVKDDEFSALSGWTTLGTLDTSNVTDLGSNWHGIRACSSDINGLYKAIPSMPFTVTMKVTAHNLVAYTTHPSVGIMLLDSTPTAIREFSYNYASGTTWSVSLRRYTNRTTFASSVDVTIVTPGPGPVYLRLLVTSSSSVTFSYSYNGYFWITPGSITAVSPTLTPAYVGILLSDPVSASSPDAYIDWIRFT